MDNGACSYRRFLNGDEEAFDEIVKEYFDIKQDSLTNEITYSLKPSKQEPVQIVYRNMSETFQAGNEILSSEEVVERYNSLIVEFSQYVDEHEKLIDTYNNLFKSYNNLIKEHNELVNLYNRTFWYGSKSNFYCLTKYFLDELCISEFFKDKDLSKILKKINTCEYFGC